MTTEERLRLAASNGNSREDSASIMGMSYDHICRIAKQHGIEFHGEPPRVKMSPYVTKTQLAYIMENERMPGWPSS